MTDRIYILRLTAKQVYRLKESFEAAFTDPDSMNDTEREVANKLALLHRHVHPFRNENRKEKGSTVATASGWISGAGKAS